VIAGLADRFGNGTVRITPEQDLLIPWIHEHSLSRVHQALASIGLADPYAGTLADVVACPGSSLCQNAITASRELAAQLSSAMAPRTRDRDLAGGWLRVSGCPHSCGQPWIGTIGLQGGAATIDGRKVPVYQLMVGGQGPGGVRLARRVIRIPALRVKDAVLHILGLFQEHRDASETLEEFLLRVDTGWLAGELANLAELAVHPGEEEVLFREPGRSLPFSVASSGSPTPGA
jgi:sulfite reductase beta subunit-like hemoprotein